MILMRATFSKEEIESRYQDFLDNKEYQDYIEDWANGKRQDMYFWILDWRWLRRN